MARYIFMANMEGKIEKKEMLKTFNCGIGMVLIVSPENM